MWQVKKANFYLKINKFWDWIFSESQSIDNRLIPLKQSQAFATDCGIIDLYVDIIYSIEDTGIVSKEATLIKMLIHQLNFISLENNKSLVRLSIFRPLIIKI